MFKRTLVSLAAAAPLLFATAPAIHADSGCTFNNGFALLDGMIPEQIGACLNGEHQAGNGTVVQETAGGLLAWNPADNLPEFTNGAVTWVLGPLGLQVRPNNVRFAYEAGGAQVAGVIVTSQQPNGNVVGYVTSLINASGVDHPVSVSAALR